MALSRPPNDLKSRAALAGILALAASVAGASAAEAFCGFYVEGSGTQLYNNATQVVLMREGTRTVLSMQNNYQGPPADFALVVPVPTVLNKEEVKILPHAVFDRIDKLAAPRLVEYWEQDPCHQQMEYDMAPMASGIGGGYGRGRAERSKARELGVTIEAKFTVGEYKILILGAKESTGLETWLHQEGYKIPAGAASLLEPYVQSGSKFFVAKVDAAKVKFDAKGMAKLSPLRFHYDSKDFSLPVRLGLMNAKDGGKQDLVVHVLARGKRYEVANYPNAFIPTNLDLDNGVRDRFGEFYAALYDATLEKNPGAVVTEYAWDATSCDPCPTPALRPNELATFGMDVLTSGVGAAGSASRGPARGTVSAPVGRMRGRRRMPRRRFRGMVLTRLHARYGAGDLKDDLVFREAGAVMGGRERFTGAKRVLEKGAVKTSRNNFQARYAIRHEWTGPIECKNPRRGIWGGPPAGVAGSGRARAAQDLAFAQRGKLRLARAVTRDIPELSVVAIAGGLEAAPAEPKTPTDGAKNPKNGAKSPNAPNPPVGPQKHKSTGCSAGTSSEAPLGLGLLLAFVLLGATRRRKPRR